MRYAKPRVYNKISRYSVYRLIINYENETYTETANQTTMDDSTEDKYYQVQKTDENRLDIISNNHYSSPIYWWVIAQANKIVDPFDVKEGTILRIPAFNSLWNYEGPLYGKM
jgi:hypothetical protein